MVTVTQGPEVEKDKILLGLLESVERNGGQSQRHLAAELGIALGLVNAYLKRCVKKGLVKVAHAPARRYAYYLTPQGFAEKSRLTLEYLTSSFSFFRQAREDCAQRAGSSGVRIELGIADETDAGDRLIGDLARFQELDLARHGLVVDRLLIASRFGKRTGEGRFLRLENEARCRLIERRDGLDGREAQAEGDQHGNEDGELPRAQGVR